MYHAHINVNIKSKSNMKKKISLIYKTNFFEMKRKKSLNESIH